MATRNRLLGLAGLVAAAGVAAASPPGGADRPQVDGREPTPIARDYYEPEVVAQGFGFVPSFPLKSLPRAAEDGGTTGTVLGYAVGHTFGANVPPMMTGDGALPLSDFASGFRDAVLNHMTVPLGTVPIVD